jgi:hypothetical protein
MSTHQSTTAIRKSSTATRRIKTTRTQVTLQLFGCPEPVTVPVERFVRSNKMFYHYALSQEQAEEYRSKLVAENQHYFRVIKKQHGDRQICLFYTSRKITRKK